MSSSPIALTCGDPNGIGPEITVKAWEKLKNELSFVLFSSFDYMTKRFPEIPIVRVDNPKNAYKVMQDALPIFDIPFKRKYLPEVQNIQFAAETIKSIEIATQFCMNRTTKALCTNPINKYILSSCEKFNFSGHTDFLKYLTQSDNAVMMLASDKLRVVPVTVHVSLKDATNLISEKLITNTIKLCNRSLIKSFRIANPRIVVTGLNPHSGEGGMFGFEEINLISPAIKALQDKINVKGPFSADSLFHRNARKNYDAVICMYHDQALIPIKTISFDSAVNITLGLPFARTSPDHGTAQDIANKGVASPSSLINSIKMAEALSYETT